MTHAHTLAKKWHKGQKHGDEPYMTHLSEVNARCYTLYRDSLSLEDVYFVGSLAWLHDIFEDTKCSPVDVWEALGHYPPTGWTRSHEMVEAIQAITKEDTETRHEYLERCSKNKFALMVKVADTLCNLERSFMSKDHRRITKYLDQLAFLSTKL